MMFMFAWIVLVMCPDAGCRFAYGDIGPVLWAIMRLRKDKSALLSPFS